MQFDPDNIVVKLCGEAMNLEGAVRIEEAHQLFLQAWNQTTNDFEKSTAAHYVARIQENIADKLTWDQTALEFVLKSTDENMKAFFPSLYLNIGKCFEDLGDLKNALKNYQSGLSFANELSKEGYGKMIRSGILKE